MYAAITIAALDRAVLQCTTITFSRLAANQFSNILQIEHRRSRGGASS